jgi:Mg/Co/Ni transporter MgtE
MKLENLQIHKDKTILEALQQLNGILYISHISRLILFVVDDDQSILGSLTDGDIRRSLVKHADLNFKAGAICNEDFVFEYEKPGFLDLQTYRKRDIKILPILDADKKLLRIVDLDKTKA